MPTASNPTQVPVHGRFSFANIVPRFTDTAVALLDGDLGSALRAFSGALGGKADEADAQAYALLWQSMKGAVRHIMGRQFGDMRPSEAQVEAFGLTQQFCQALWKALPDLDIAVDRDFVANPTQHPATIALRGYLRDWMQREMCLHPDAARVATAAFPRLMLAEMSALPKADFKQLFEYFEKPFLPAEEKAQAMDAYQAEVMSEFHRPAFNNRQVSLAEMYVPPFFRFFQSKKVENGEAERVNRDADFIFPEKKCHLQDLLDLWLRGQCPAEMPRSQARVMLLLGQPGQGKSSFCRQTAHRLLADDVGLAERVFLLRLRDLENRPEFVQKPLDVAVDWLREYEFRKVGLEKADLTGGLLILDGLDEFYMNNGLSHDDVDHLLRNLEHALSLEARSGYPMRCLVTSRNNYVRLDRHHSTELLTLQIAEMSLAEQNDWLDRYERGLAPDAAEQRAFAAELRPELAKLGENEDDKNKNLRELVNQPILLQIVVEAQVNPARADNRAALYEGLFNRMVQRSWDTGQIRSLQALAEGSGPRLFREFLQALALHIFYSEREYARRSDFSEKPLADAVANLQKAFGEKQNPDDFLKNLLISFYFKEVRKDADDRAVQDERSPNYAYEFLHKSLQEYLVAEAIWTYFREELTETSRRTGDFVKDDQTAMAEVFDLFSPRLMTLEVVDYLYEFAKKDPDLGFLEKTLFPRTKKLMAGLAEHSFLWKYDATAAPPLSRRRATPMEQSLAVFYGVLTVNSAVVARMAEGIVWPGALEEGYEERRESLSEQLNFLPNINESCAFLTLLGRRLALFRLSIYGADIRESILVGATLDWIDLIGCNLHFTDLSGVNMTGMKLYGANLGSALLHMANLNQADLYGASLQWANLSSSSLTNANLSEASLIGTILGDANLYGADLSMADLRFSSLVRANLRGAYLIGANLSQANMEGACFTNSYFAGAYLYGADMYEADLKGAWFNNVDGDNPAFGLENILNLHLAKNLDQADWRGTIFEGRDWAAWVAEEKAKEEAEKQR